MKQLGGEWKKNLGTLRSVLRVFMLFGLGKKKKLLKLRK